jgi:hypothetical protein
MAEATTNKKNISKHILPTSSNLLGLCFVILSFIKILKLGKETVVDELVVVAIVLFFISSFCSYASMRSIKWSESYEKIADTIFLIGLFILSIGSVLVAYQVIR